MLEKFPLGSMDQRPPLATHSTKTRIPLYGALGPFPDEPLLSTIDRFLFWLGCKRFHNDSSSERSSGGDYCRSRCLAEKEISPNAHHNNETGECRLEESPTFVIEANTENSKRDKCCCKKLKFPQPPLCHFSNKPEQNISALENSCRKESQQIGKPLRSIKRSFSLCSLACRKLKEQLKCAEAAPDHSPKWLWTKMAIHSDGVQVYEVFKNSTAAAHPTKLHTSKAPKIIFVVLPNGYIMPFETLPHH